MTVSFSQQILDGSSITSVNCVGYNEKELEKVSRLYDISLQGQLKPFLSSMGKSDGGLIGDSMIQLYRPSWRVREHLFFQLGFIDQMQEEGFYDCLKKPFVFSLIAETQYYFIQTSLKNDVVYHYDSNNEAVKATNWDLLNFLKKLTKENNGKLKTQSMGNLLII